MKLFSDIHALLIETFIRGMFFSVVFVICAGYAIKGSDTKQPLNILRWIIVANAVIGIVSFFAGITIYERYLDRATGPYWWSYLLMLSCALLLPFVLVIKNSKSLILVISFAINIGWFFERFVIFVTSLHRDYAPPSEHKLSLLSLIPLTPLYSGISIGLLAFLIGNAISRNKAFILSKN